MEYDFRRRLESELTILRLWRRFRSAPSSARRRSRLGLLAAIIAAFALMGNGYAYVKWRLHTRFDRRRSRSRNSRRRRERNKWVWRGLPV